MLVPRLLAGGRYLILLAVLSSLASSAAVLFWATARMIFNVRELLEYPNMANGAAAQQGIHMIAVLDAFLLAIVLYIFAVGLYELFIGEIKVPSWLVIRNLDDLKKKLISVIVLVMAVTFVEHLVQWKRPEDTLMFGAAAALVITSLTLYSRFGNHDHE